MLILIRHAAPDVDLTMTPAEWNLSDEGRDGAASLAEVLPADAVLVTSEEPKAQQTLAPSGEVSIDGRFNEIWRDEAVDANHRALRSA
jgi:broad specificity phosphatase PhoE